MLSSLVRVAVWVVERKQVQSGELTRKALPFSHTANMVVPVTCLFLLSSFYCCLFLLFFPPDSIFPVNNVQTDDTSN